MEGYTVFYRRKSLFFIFFLLLATSAPLQLTCIDEEIDQKTTRESWKTTALKSTAGFISGTLVAAVIVYNFSHHKKNTPGTNLLTTLIALAGGCATNLLVHRFSFQEIKRVTTQIVNTIRQNH